VVSASMAGSAWDELKRNIAACKQLKGRYRPIRFVNQGATGYLVQVEELTLRAPRAMKILKPGLPNIKSKDGSRTRSLASYFSAEVERLRDVNHENVVKVYERGTVTLTILNSRGRVSGTRRSPFYVMDFIDGAPLLGWLKDGLAKLQRADLIRLLTQVASGLRAVHEHDVLHGDIKPDNVLVTASGNVRLTDFGFAKSLVRDVGGNTFWCQDKRFLHPELEERLSKSAIKQPTDTGRSIIEVSIEEIEKKGVVWELHSLGATIQHVLRLVVELDREQRILNRNDLGFLEIAARRLTEARSNGPWTIPNWSDRYKSVAPLVEDLTKLLPGHSLAGEVPEYDCFHEDTIRIPLCDRIPFTKRLQPIIDHPVFQRLGRSTQLGVVHFVFRSAQHTRLEHSLGVMHHAMEYARALRQSPADQYFHEACGTRELEALLLAALLHDIGQYPFAHAFEESEIKGSTLFSHEALTKALLSASTVDELAAHMGQPDLFASESDRKRVAEVILDDDGHAIGDYLCPPAWKATLEDVLSVLGHTRSTTLVPAVRDVLHDVVDGPIDADKMDYLRRDALHLDVRPGGAVDLSRFLHSLTTVSMQEPEDGETVRDTRRLALDHKGIGVAEDILMARYHMFVEVYWTRVVRAAERMLRHAVDGIRALMGEVSFRQTFFVEVLTSSDQELLRRLHDIASELTDKAEQEQRVRAKGYVECIARVRRRKLHREGLELDAQHDKDLYDKLSSFWSRALRDSGVRSEYVKFERKLTEEMSTRSQQTWDEWQLLLDIPDPRSERPKKYQFHLLLRDGTPGLIQKESTTWLNFSNQFRIHARHIRAFVAREHYRKGKEEEKQMAAALRESVSAALKEVPETSTLPLTEEEANA